MTRLLLLALLGWLPALALAAELSGYRVVERMPQSRENFVQGLQIVDQVLYVSSGGYGQSRLLRYSMADGRLLDSRQLPPQVFAEGLTVVDDRLFQLTWREGLVLVWDLQSLRPTGTLPITTQGWGITWNGQQLIYSDGSDRLYFMNPDSGVISHSIAVRDGDLAVTRLNELEWIDGHVWANVWQTDEIVIIDPRSGRVTGRLDLTGLLPESDRQPGTDVLNGIARDPATGALWVTGKRWPWIYRIERVPPGASGPEPGSATPR